MKMKNSTLFALVVVFSWCFAGCAAVVPLALGVGAGGGTYAVMKVTDKEDGTVVEKAYVSDEQSQNLELDLSSRETIRFAQQALNAKGYNCGQPDGVLGKKTSDAIGGFQKDHGVHVTGALNVRTAQMLGIYADLKTNSAQNSLGNGSSSGKDNVAQNNATMSKVPMSIVYPGSLEDCREKILEILTMKGESVAFATDNMIKTTPRLATAGVNAITAWFKSEIKATKIFLLSSDGNKGTKVTMQVELIKDTMYTDPEVVTNAKIENGIKSEYFNALGKSVAMK